MKILNLVKNLSLHVIPAILRQAQDGEHRRTKAGIYLNRFRIKSGMTMVLIAVLSLSFFWPVWWQGKLPIPADALVGLYHPFRDYFSDKFPQGVPYKNFILTDPVLQQYPWKWLSVQGWKENPYNFSGAPLLANIQAGAFYPLNLIFLVGDFSRMWTVFIMLQPILASLFMFWWLKNKGLDRLPAVFGSLVWAFSSFNMVWLEWGNISHAGLWLPLSMLCIDKIKNEKLKIKNSWKWHALMQFSLISSLFAGHLQVTFYLLMAVTLYWFIRLGISKRSISLLLASCLLFLVFTSIQWIPSLKFTLSSNRDVEQRDILTREGFFIQPKQLVQAVSPDFFGNPATLNYRGAWNYSEQVIYIGIIPLILAISVSLRRKSHLLNFSLAITLGGLLFATDNPISRLPYVYNFPILSDLQPTRLSYLIIFGLSTLSALGFNGFIKQPRKLFSKIFSAITIIFFILFILLVVSSKFGPENKLISQRNLIVPAATLMVFSTAVGGSMILKKTGILNNRNLSLLLASCFLLLSIFDLFRFGWKFTPFSPPDYLYPITPAIRFLQENMKDGDRYMTLDRRILPPNANIMFGLKSIEGYDPIYSREYALKITEMEIGQNIGKPLSFGRIVRPANYKSPVTKELNVKYVLNLKEIEDPILIKVFQEGETRIYRHAK